MSALKVGDLVMVASVIPCCKKSTGSEGAFFTITKVEQQNATACIFCNHPNTALAIFGLSHGLAIRSDRLKKIDPPATGETTEAYRNIKVPA